MQAKDTQVKVLEKQDGLREEGDHLWKSGTVIFETCDTICQILTFHPYRSNFTPIRTRDLNPFNDSNN